MSDQIDLEERRVDKENDKQETETYAKLSLGIKGSDSKCHSFYGRYGITIKMSLNLRFLR